MKILIIALSLFLSMITFAKDTNKELFKSLAQAVQIDCAMGSCYIGADQLKCRKDNSSENNNSARCEMIDYTEDKKVFLANKKAERLFMALVLSGAPVQNVSHSSSIQLKSVRCQYFSIYDDDGNRTTVDLSCSLTVDLPFRS